MLSQSQVADLYAAKDRKRAGASKGMAFTLDENGSLQRQTVKRMGTYEFGAYEGRVGSIRRSRKGATRRMPNGTRKYITSHYDGIEVVAYKLKVS